MVKDKTLQATFFAEMHKKQGISYAKPVAALVLPCCVSP